MLDTIAGLPIHPLIVHATVVIVPAAALAVALAALVPRFRRWAGIVPLGLSALRRRAARPARTGRPRPGA